METKFIIEVKIKKIFLCFLWN